MVSEGKIGSVARLPSRPSRRFDEAAALVRPWPVCSSLPLNTCAPGGEHPGESGTRNADWYADPQDERVAGLGGQGLSRGGVTGQNRLDGIRPRGRPVPATPCRREMTGKSTIAAPASPISGRAWQVSGRSSSRSADRRSPRRQPVAVSGKCAVSAGGRPPRGCQPRTRSNSLPSWLLMVPSPLWSPLEGFRPRSCRRSRRRSDPSGSGRRRTRGT
jgi:hypothetical protein